MTATIFDDENSIILNVIKVDELGEGQYEFETWHQPGQKYTKSGDVRTPVYYIPTDEEVLEKSKADLKNARNLALSQVIVLIGDKEVWADPDNEQNITGRIRQMELAGQASCKWIQGDDVFVLTLTELQTVLSEGTAKCAKIFDDYIAAIEAL